jgi:hypothetical protein
MFARFVGEVEFEESKVQRLASNIRQAARNERTKVVKPAGFVAVCHYSGEIALLLRPNKISYTECQETKHLP